MTHGAAGIALFIAGAVLEFGGSVPSALGGAGFALIMIGLVFDQEIGP